MSIRVEDLEHLMEISRDTITEDDRMVIEALRMGNKAHEGQVRKYTGEPYMDHCVAVANMYLKRFPADMTGYIATLLHDTIEDTNLDYYDIDHAFGKEVADIVLELTDVYTLDKYSDLNRAKRKERETYRLSDISPRAQTIKYCDLINNTESIVSYDKGFARVFLAEKWEILKTMNKGDTYLYYVAMDTCIKGMGELGMDYYETAKQENAA